MKSDASANPRVHQENRQPPWDELIEDEGSEHFLFKIMKRKFGFITLLIVASTVAAAKPDWKPVQQILGREGKVDEQVLRVTYARKDLHVMKDGLSISAELVFDSWYGFWPMEDGSVMLMGDTCVTESELPGVLEEIDRQGLDLTALHNHLTGEMPRIMFLHLSGHGMPAELAQKVKAVLARTAAPTGEEPGATKVPVPDWSAVTAILGEPAEKEGDIIEYGYLRKERLSMHRQTLPSTDALETAPEVKLQMLKDGRAITYGEMILTAKEVSPVFHTLTAHGISVSALHNHMVDEEPRLFFMHWWAVGAPADLATGIRAALALVNIRPERETR